MHVRGIVLFNTREVCIFEVAVEDNASVSGVILADQVKSLDWRARQAKRKGRYHRR